MKGKLFVFFSLVAFANALVEIEDFFNFGVDHGDTYLSPGDDTSSPQTNISTVFPFFGYNHSSLWVNVNGAISFNSKISRYTPTCAPVENDFRMISPFWGDVDTNNEHPSPSHAVSYRESTTTEDLEKAKAEIVHAFPDFEHLDLTWSFIVTWNNVTYFPDDANRDMRNSFQAAIATDGRHSFAIFYYNKIQWTTGRASDNDENRGDGFGGTQAQIGFDAGDTTHREMLDISCTHEVMNIVNMSNVGKPGVFVFRIDEAEIIKPPTPAPEVIVESAECPPNSIRLRANSSICYSFHPSLSQFVVAERECNSFGATLVSMKNKYTSVYITQLANLLFKHLEVEKFWINGHRLMDQRTFEHADGEDFKFSNWQKKDGFPIRAKRASIFPADIGSFHFVDVLESTPTPPQIYVSKLVPLRNFNNQNMDDCVGVNLEKGFWNPENCFDRLPFVCEFIPEEGKEVPPTALTLEDFSGDIHEFPSVEENETSSEFDFN